MVIKTLKMLFAVSTSVVLAACSSIPNDAPIAVLVEIDRPSNTTDQTLVEGFKTAEPIYRQVPGLERKYFVFSDSVFGGVYLWENTAAAQSFFDAAWQERILQTYGQAASLTYFDAPVETEGGNPNSSGIDGVVAIVKVGAPWYAPRGAIVSRMEESVPQYQSIAGLDYKIYSIADAKQVGGIYLWDDPAAASNFFNADWHARIRETYGSDADLFMYSAPVIVVNTEDGGS